MDKNEKDLLIKQNEQFRKAYDRYGDRLLSIIPDDSLETISGGNGRWFILDNHVCGLCDDCKIWSYDPDAFCAKCRKKFKRSCLGKDIPDEYDFDAFVF
ncbi:MAG: hypothetical protein IKG37_04905 [Solobacterium sp.]|nr:hypothetical protein [Solobacterium sp.]